MTTFLWFFAAWMTFSAVLVFYQKFKCFEFSYNSSKSGGFLMIQVWWDNENHLQIVRLLDDANITYVSFWETVSYKELDFYFSWQQPHILYFRSNFHWQLLSNTCIFIQNSTTPRVVYKSRLVLSLNHVAYVNA